MMPSPIVRLNHGERIKIVSMTLFGDFVEIVVEDNSGFVAKFGVSVEYARQFAVGSDVLVEFLPRPAK